MSTPILTLGNFLQYYCCFALHILFASSILFLLSSFLFLLLLITIFVNLSICWAVKFCHLHLNMSTYSRVEDKISRRNICDEFKRMDDRTRTKTAYKEFTFEVIQSQDTNMLKLLAKYFCQNTCKSLDTPTLIFINIIKIN